MILIIKRKFDCFGSVLSDKDAIGFPFLCKDSKFQTVLKRIFILHPLVKSAILYIWNKDKSNAFEQYGKRGK